MNTSFMSRVKKQAIIFLVTVLILVVAGISIFIWIQGKPAIRFGEQRSAVISQIQLLNKYETASFTIDRIIEAKTEHTGIKEFLFGDKLILIAQGTVVAGIDMNKVDSHQFSGMGNKIHIHLPAPEIFSVSLNNNGTKVFNRDTGLLTKGEVDLEAKARQEATSVIRQAACEGNILDIAAQNAKKQIELMLRSSGFETIQIDIESQACAK